MNTAFSLQEGRRGVQKQERRSKRNSFRGNGGAETGKKRKMREKKLEADRRFLEANIIQLRTRERAVK